MLLLGCLVVSKMGESGKMARIEIDNDADTLYTNKNYYIYLWFFAD